MKTYVVNMTKDIQKRTEIERQLKLHPELDYQVWEAVEGRKLSEEEQTRLILPEFKIRYGRHASLPAAGCSLSHIGIYKDIISSRTQYALILEDDAILSGDLKLDSISELLDTDTPIAILLTSDFWYHKKNKVKTIDGLHEVFEVVEGYMTSGYLINRAAAELLLRYIFPVQYTADSWSIFMTFGLKLLGVVPHLISFPDGVGEIGISQLKQDEPYYMKIRHKLGRLKAAIHQTINYMMGVRKSSKLWI